KPAAPVKPAAKPAPKRAVRATPAKPKAPAPASANIVQDSGSALFPSRVWPD
ncbi:MAG: hypothetical protein FD132_2526, partial [bacterium]